MPRLYFLIALFLCLLFASGESKAQDIPQMKFNEVREVAPGVFFRFASVSPTDPSVFGGCNNIWVVFKDYVLVYDANFPKEAGDVIAAVRKTTNKPIKYVLDSHHHGDHAYGNAVWAKEGASIIAQKNCVTWLKTKGADEFAKAGKPPTGRKDIANSYLKIPDIVFDDKLVFDDGKQRAEILFFGHCHTPGDATLYLPKHKILCTGDACVNGAYNFMGHCNSASWIENLEKMQQLDVRLLLPGHGPLTGKELLAKQRRYFVELREQVKQGIDKGKDVEDIIKSMDMPWYKEWTGVSIQTRVDNVKHVYDEFMGRTFDWELVEDFGIYEGPSPTKDTPAWTKPKRIVVPNLLPSQLNQLKQIAPQVFFVPVKTAEEAAREAANADAVLGFFTADIARAGKKLRWIQLGYGGVEDAAKEHLNNRKIVITDLRQIDGTDVSEQAFALLLALTRGIDARTARRIPLPKPGVIDLHKRWNTLKRLGIPKQLYGKTMLVIGLGGVGQQIGKRAHAFGMKVMAVDARAGVPKPNYIFNISLPTKLMHLLPQADVVVLACPLPKKNGWVIGKEQLAVMKPQSYLINVGRSDLVDTTALVKALKSRGIAGAGLDVTDPQPLPNDHPLWLQTNVVISPNIGGMSAAARKQQWRLWRENVRRFVNGERLLSVME